MEQPHPIAIVLPGAERWHRAGVIRYATEAGLVPLLAVQQGENVVIEGPIQPLIGGVLTMHEQLSEAELKVLAGRMDKLCQRWFVLPLDDYVCETASRLSQHASAVCFPPASAQECFHKHLLRERWNKYCTEHSELPLHATNYALYHPITDSSEIGVVQASEGFSRSKGPFLVKPDAYSGSVGIFHANDIAAIPLAMERCGAVMERESVNPEMEGITIDRHILAEEEIPRKQGLAGCAEFTAHYLSFNGEHILLGIAEKFIDPVTYIETAHVFPSPAFPLEFQPILNKVATDLLNGLQVQNTISNWEFIITPDDKLALVEGQLRPSGDNVMDLIENACLFSPYTLFFDSLKMGVLPVGGLVPVHTSVICWPRPVKVIDRISRVDTPVHLPKGIHIHADHDSLLQSRGWQGPLSWYDRHISVMATAPNSTEAWALCQQAISQCRLKGITADGKHLETELRF